MKKDTYYIYTDGSSNPRKKLGGWSFCVTDNPKSKTILGEAQGHAKRTTNNRMELVAVINSLHYAYCNMSNLKALKIYSDSKYVSDPVYYGWITDWRNAGWINLSGEPTKNADLWEDMYQILKRFRFRKIRVDIMWVKGHNGHYFNDRADRLAKKGRYDQKINMAYE